MEMLIEEVRVRPVLWDCSLEDYRDCLLKDTAWEEVATLVDENKKTVRRKWKKLRDCHRQALQRRKTTTGQSGNRKKWKYEDEMQFLLKTMVHRSSDSNVFPLPSDAAQVGSNDADGDGDADAVGLLSDEETELQLDNYAYCALPSAAVTSDSGHSTPTTTRIEKSVDKVVSFMREKYEHKVNTENRKELDDIDLFFASAAQSVRRLPRRLQNKVKLQLVSSIAAAEEEEEEERGECTSVAARTEEPTANSRTS